jgi:adenylate cyclase
MSDHSSRNIERNPADVQNASAVPSDSVATRLQRALAWAKHFKTAIVTVAGVGAVLSGLAGYDTTYKAVSGTSATTSPVLAQAAKNPFSIAVLPFVNLTGDPTQDYVADGLTSNLTTDLARIQNALIAPTESVQALTRKSLSLPEMAAGLGVRFVLQGNVQQGGDKLRINAKLTDTMSGTQLWSETFNGDLSDVFALQDQITTRISTSVGEQIVVLVAGENVTRKGEPKVADLLLRIAALRIKPILIANFDAAEALARQALALEPQNAQAMLALAQALTFRSYNFQSTTSKVADEKRCLEADELVKKLRDVHPNNTDVLATVGYIAAIQGDAEGFKLASKARLETQPRNWAAHNGLGLIYWYELDIDKAIGEFKNAIALFPNGNNEIALVNLGRAYFMKGDDAQAIQWMRKGFDLNPGRAGRNMDWLAMAYARSGQMDKANDAARAFIKARPDVRLATALGLNKLTQPAFQQWHDTVRAPLWRKAGLPE